MRHLVEFDLKDGETVVVEVDQSEAEGGTVRVARPGEIAVKASQSFETALERVRPTAAIIIAKLRGLGDPPDEIEVEFGLKMSAEAGAVIAVAGAEANYRILLKWKRQETQNE